MVALDCETPDSAIGSIAKAAGVKAGALRQVLAASEPDKLYADWDDESLDRLPFEPEDPSSAIPRRWLAELGVDLDLVQFDRTCFFHGSRVRNPSSFVRQGIRPLGDMVDQIWSELYDLVADEIDPSRWATLRRQLDGRSPHTGGHSAHLYRSKVGDRIHHGPFAQLVREHSLNPPWGMHDYLDIPEIVEDIARCVGMDLEMRFRRSTTPCIVKFARPRAGVGDLASALFYAYSELHKVDVGLNGVGGIACDGPVLPSEVLYVQPVEPAGRGLRVAMPERRIFPSSTGS